MKDKGNYRDLILEIICFLFIVLFLYAAVSKLLDFDNFRIQLGQSPVLTAFADRVVWIVPALEMIISIMLVSSRSRLLGLYTFVGLMSMFTTYIIIILNFSTYIPCSCGGILENLGWKEHLAFNFCFLLLGIVAILMSSVQKPVITFFKIKTLRNV